MFTIQVDVLPENIKKLRVDSEKTQEEVAAALDKSLSTVQKLEQGDTLPTLDTLYDLCELYDVEFRIRKEHRHPKADKRKKRPQIESAS